VQSGELCTINLISMNIHQLHEYYWLNGGAIKSFHLDIQKILQKSNYWLVGTVVENYYLLSLMKEIWFPVQLN
jgi:hypothetical protein